MNKININLSHVFLHFFEIGGGEKYLYRFQKYSQFNETIYVKKNNITPIIQFKNIIYYESYEELNKLLLVSDIILDHQLYWFEKDISDIVFKNIDSKKIIRITHGVPIHFEDITGRDYSYSIELYTERKSHISWNNHIKYYVPLGVEIPQLKERAFNSANIQIAIIGRITPLKIPAGFLQKLVKYVNGQRGRIKIHIYGPMDAAYQTFFLSTIRISPFIQYHGIIKVDDIREIYESNDILLHPSNEECGATVILEAMSYGLPVICRGVGGLLEAVGKHNFQLISNGDDSLIQNLAKINESNYMDISVKNREKIIKYNNEDDHFRKLFDIIERNHRINNLNNDMGNKIPNIIHYIFGLKEQTENFLFPYFLSIYSNYVINKPDIIYFHYQFEPHGEWWEKAKPYLSLNYVNGDNLYWGSKRIVKYAHKADKIRLDILYKYGGIYMDIDTITYRPYHHLLRYDTVLGYQDEGLICNAVILAKSECAFIKRWMDEYETHFKADGWCEASVHLPYKIYESMRGDDNIHIVEREFFYSPSYDETDKIFVREDVEIHEKLLTLHLWNTYSEDKYLRKIIGFDYVQNSRSLYAKILCNILIDSKLNS